MRVSELHAIFLTELGALLPDWRFNSTYRDFKKTHGSVNWLLHVSCINHSEDFDAVVDIAVEFLDGRRRVAIFGAQLGNIAGLGQTRHPVSSAATARTAARAAFDEFERVGLPFLRHHSSRKTVVSTLEAGGQLARAISPLTALHSGQIQALMALEDELNGPGDRRR